MKILGHLLLLKLLLISGCGQPPSYLLREFGFEERPEQDDALGTPTASAPSQDPNTPTTPQTPTQDPTKDKDVDVIKTNPPVSSPQGAVTAEACTKQGKKLVAPDLVFMVDNSGSNIGSRSSDIPTDCPQKSDRQCLGDPVRKLTVLEVAKDLQNIALQQNTTAATSSFSIVEFSTSATKRIENLATNAALNFGRLASDLDFTKSPSGYTSYLAAFRAARSILQNQNSSLQRPKVVINITDGFPTDKPQAIYDEAQSLRSSGVKVITVVYSQQTQLETLAAQWARNSSLSQAERDWVIGEGRDSIVSDISDHALLVKDVSKLPELVSYLAQQNGFVCN